MAGLMDEEEINPTEEEGSGQSSFAYDLERSVPTRLGTILDDFSEEDEEEDVPDSLATPNHRSNKAVANA